MKNRNIENEELYTEEQLLEEEAAESAAMIDSMKQYLREMGSIPLLTQQEEIELGRRVQAGKDAQLLLAEGIGDEEYRRALQKLVRQGKAALDQLVEGNLRLVIDIAKKYTDRGLSLQDLIQEGNIGLIRAAGKFDPEMGNRFSTVASWWIRQSITRAVTDRGRMIRLPGHVFQQVSHLRKAETELAEELDRTPTEAEIAERLNISVKKVKELRDCAQQPASIDAPIGGDDNSNISVIGTIDGGNTTEEIDERLTREALKAVMKKAIAGLNERELQVVTMRYDLDGKGIRTLEQVGEELGLTRERVRQIEKRAMRSIRTGPASKELKSFIA